MVLAGQCSFHCPGIRHIDHAVLRDQFKRNQKMQLQDNNKKLMRITLLHNSVSCGAFFFFGKNKYLLILLSSVYVS